VTELPLALALVAGAVAAFNPCGFALLPAYLTILVAERDGADAGTTRTAIGRGVRFAAGMTLGFVAVFGVFAAVVTPLALAVERYLPAVTVLVGLSLLVVGALLLSGRTARMPTPTVTGRAPTSAWLSQVSYGVTFALASLSCTIGPFLAVTSTALRAGDALGVALTFVAYALGMGTVVLVLAVAAATARGSLLARSRRLAPYLPRIGGVLLLVAGAYVTWYGIYEIRVLSGGTSSDPVVAAGIEVQSRVSTWVADLGAGAIAVVAATCAALLAAVAVTRRRLARRPVGRDA
jgi:cytochrome c biogenesis protein CcdA